MFDGAGDQADGLRRLFAPRRLRLLALTSALAPHTTWQAVQALFEAWRLARTPAGLVDLLGTDLSLAPGGPPFAHVDGHRTGRIRALDRMARAAVRRVAVAGAPAALHAWLDEPPPALVMLVTDDPAALAAQYLKLKTVLADGGPARLGLWAAPCPDVDERRRRLARARLDACVRRFIGSDVRWLDDTAQSDAAAPAHDGAAAAAGAAVPVQAFEELSFEPRAIRIDPMMEAALAGPLAASRAF